MWGRRSESHVFARNSTESHQHIRATGSGQLLIGSREAGAALTESAPPAKAPSIPHGRIARAFSMQLVCRALGMLASVVSVAMTARYLGPGPYGQLMIAVV